MTADQFRKLALRLPEALEGAHMGHPDFRVRGKIFATLGPDETWAMVKLTPEQQAAFIQEEPKAFQPIKGAWGLKGATQVILKQAKRASVWPALQAAWHNTAPRDLLEQFPDE